MKSNKSAEFLSENKRGKSKHHVKVTIPKHHARHLFGGLNYFFGRGGYYNRDNDNDGDFGSFGSGGGSGDMGGADAGGGDAGGI